MRIWFPLPSLRHSSWAFLSLLINFSYLWFDHFISLAFPHFSNSLSTSQLSLSVIHACPIYPACTHTTQQIKTRCLLGWLQIRQNNCWRHELILLLSTYKRSENTFDFAYCQPASVKFYSSLGQVAGDIFSKISQGDFLGKKLKKAREIVESWRICWLRSKISVLNVISLVFETFCNLG